MYAPEGDPPLLGWPVYLYIHRSQFPYFVYFFTSSDAGVGPSVVWTRMRYSPLVSARVDPSARVISRAHILTCKTEHRRLTVLMPPLSARPWESVPRRGHRVTQGPRAGSNSVLASRRAR
jgi:hypothetical protein